MSGNVFIQRLQTFLIIVTFLRFFNIFLFIFERFYIYVCYDNVCPSVTLLSHAYTIISSKYVCTVR